MKSTDLEQHISEVFRDQEGIADHLPAEPTLAGEALIAAIFGLLSLLCFMPDEPLFLGMGLLSALVAVVMGIRATLKINKFSEEFWGIQVAGGAILASLLFASGGVALQTYRYMTEVPEGYSRLAFADLQPDIQKEEIYGVTKKAIELHGQPVFMSGYIHPGVSGMGRVSKFVLVNDFGTCCFGGPVKPSHMVEVTVVGKDRVKYSTHRVKLAGKFLFVPPAPGRKGIGGVDPGIYQLEADKVLQ